MSTKILFARWKIEQTDGQEYSRTRTNMFGKAASNFLLRKICSTFSFHIITLHILKSLLDFDSLQRMLLIFRAGQN